MDIIAQHNQKMKVFHDIIGCAFDVYNEYRPGLTEYPYQYCLKFLLKWLGYDVRKEYDLPLYLFQQLLPESYRCDLVLVRQEGNIIIECKAKKCILEEHRDQLKNYMLLTHCPFGVLINFTKPSSKGGQVYSEVYQYHEKEHYVDRLDTKYIGTIKEYTEKPWKRFLRQSSNTPLCILPEIKTDKDYL